MKCSSEDVVRLNSFKSTTTNAAAAGSNLNHRMIKPYHTTTTFNKNYEINYYNKNNNNNIQFKLISNKKSNSMDGNNFSFENNKRYVFSSRINKTKDQIVINNSSNMKKITNNYKNDILECKNELLKNYD